MDWLAGQGGRGSRTDGLDWVDGAPRTDWDYRTDGRSGPTGSLGWTDEAPVRMSLVWTGGVHRTYPVVRTDRLVRRT